jgi:uncharacterized membrane protein
MDFNSPRIPTGIWVLIGVIVIVVGLALYGYLTGAWEYTNVC